MCLVDYGEDHATILLAETRKTRKEHECHECYRVISRGESYLNEKHKGDGVISDYKVCLHCDVARKWLSAECGGYIYTSVQEDILEHAHEENYGLPVAKLAAGMRAKWRRKNGQLFSIPKLPPLSEKGKL